MQTDLKHAKRQKPFPPGKGASLQGRPSKKTLHPGKKGGVGPTESRGRAEDLGLLNVCSVRNMRKT